MRTPTFVAELSANHLGSLERALALVDAAAKAGADAVKLQTYDPVRMAGNADLRIEAGPWKGRKLVELYREAMTPLNWHKRLFARAGQHGMAGFSSAFSTEDVDALEELGCPVYKIASFELVDLPLIKFAAQTGKPIILSTGMASLPEIEDGVAMATDAGCRDLTVLKCSSSYPAKDVNLSTIMDMREYFGPAVKIGFSDHTRGIGAAVAAIGLGAVMIEKHLTIARADGGPDAQFSAEPAEFAAMVQAGREAFQSIGTVHYGPTEEEAPSLALRRSLWWAAPVRAGAVVLAKCIRTARPACGMHPRELANLIGRKAVRDVEPGTPVLAADFL